MTKTSRPTIEDLLFSGSSEDFDIGQDARSGKLRVIKKKKAGPPPELYRNETELKKAATDFLDKLPQCKLLRTDNMALMVGNKRKVKTRNPGMADHHLCITGLFVAVEAKMPGKDLDPDQVKYRGDILSAGGIFIVYHSLFELVEELKKHRLISRKFELN